MKEFIDKLISRLEELKKHYHKCCLVDYNEGAEVALIESISIVNQLAEEYKHCTLCYLQSPCEYQNENAILPASELADKNGWIPCEKELPPQPKENPLFENKPLELYMVSTNAEYPFRAFWNGRSFTDGFGEVDAIAWQPLPPKFEPKGK